MLKSSGIVKPRAFQLPNNLFKLSHLLCYLSNGDISQQAQNTMHKSIQKAIENYEGLASLVQYNDKGSILIHSDNWDDLLVLLVEHGTGSSYQVAKDLIDKNDDVSLSVLLDNVSVSLDGPVYATSKQEASAASVTSDTSVTSVTPTATSVTAVDQVDLKAAATINIKANKDMMDQLTKKYFELELAEIDARIKSLNSVAVAAPVQPLPGVEEVHMQSIGQIIGVVPVSNRFSSIVAYEYERRNGQEVPQEQQYEEKEWPWIKKYYTVFNLLGGPLLKDWIVQVANVRNETTESIKLPMNLEEMTPVQFKSFLCLRHEAVTSSRLRPMAPSKSLQSKSPRPTKM